MIEHKHIKRIERLNELVKKVGSTRLAEKAIKELVGFSPSKSTIHAATKSKHSNYMIESMIRDLERFIEQEQQVEMKKNEKFE